MHCQNEYCQSEFEKILNACSKHKNAALELKQVCENQKKKLRDYRELNSRLYEDIDALESDIKENDDFTNRLKKQRNDLENERKYLMKKVEVKNEDIIQMEITSSKQKEKAIVDIRALEDENVDLKQNLKMTKKKMDELESENKTELFKKVDKKKRNFT